MERIAIVTGAARGIGLAITNALLRDGCTVVGVDRDEQTVARASRQHREAGASPVKRPNTILYRTSPFPISRLKQPVALTGMPR